MKVDVGELKNILKAKPELETQLALGYRCVISERSKLGDYAGIIIIGADGNCTPEIIMPKNELRRFAQEILDKIQL